jgi:hypothetical protein
MPRHANLADQYRAHREEMELVLATGCTPIEARRELRRREKERRAACGRLDMSDRPAAGADNLDFDNDQASRAPDFGEWRAPWMMRD